MLGQFLTELVVNTRGRGFYDLTNDVAAALRGSGLKRGLATLHLRHTSASLVIQENADPDVRVDLENFFRRLVPDGDRLFTHISEGPDDMPGHIRAALTAVNLSVPFSGGELVLGIWQAIYVWEHRTAPHRRQVVVHFLGE
jgi:secondary thiamine-phosphate synthase enzyme